MLRYLNPRTWVWEGADADYTPMSDDLPWCMDAIASLSENQ